MIAPERKRIRKWVMATIIVLMVPYLGVVIMLLWLENRLVFQAIPASEYWAEKPSSRLEDVWLELADGSKIHAWWNPPPSGRTETMIICHGNSGNVSGRGPTMLRFGDELQRGILLFDYPGYGQSTGTPSEANCYESAVVAYDWLIAQGYPADRLVIYGESLGGGVAVELAIRKPHQALVLMKTFTSLPDAAKARYPIVPTHWLMTNRFDNLAKIARCPAPILIVGGTADSIVPYALSVKLFEAAPEPKRLIPLPGDEHNSPLPADFLSDLRGFLREN